METTLLLAVAPLTVKEAKALEKYWKNAAEEIEVQ